MAENKVEFGIENVYIAPLTDTGTELKYEAPFHFPGAVTLTLTPAGSQDPFYADNMKYYVANSNQGYTGKFESARVVDAFQTKILGATFDANHNMIENSETQPCNFAMMFQFSGDKSSTYHVLYNVQAARAGLSGATKKDKTDIKPTDVTLTISPNPYTKIVKMHTTLDTPKQIVDDWFKTVQIPASTPVSQNVAETDAKVGE